MADTKTDQKVDLKHELDAEKNILASTGDIEAVDAIYAQQYTKGIVPETDDPAAPSLTIRMVFLGALFAIFLGLANGIFSFRTNSFYITNVVAALLSYPMGIFFSKVLPRGILNPGPFTVKEHVLIYTIAGAAGGAPYGIENVIGQKMEDFMNDPHVTFWNSLLFIISTQMIGYGLSGMTRRFLVRPAAMYWPTVLPTVALFIAFHEKEEDEDEEVKKVGGLSRYSFFWVAFVFSFIWQWFPSYFAGVVQAISILCWISSNKTARFLGSASPNMGVGVLSLSFDWSNISIYGPLSWPWWATMNVFFSNIVVTWIIIPIAYYQNWFGNPVLAPVYSYEDDTDFPRVNSPALFTRAGKRIRATVLYDRTNFDLNQTAFDEVKPIYLTEHFAIGYSLSFMALTCGISHVGLWYYQDIIRQTKEMIAQVDEETPDIHNTLMKAYPDIPEWMYLSWLGFWLLVQMLVGIFTPFRLQWWGTLFGLVLAFVFTIPYGIIQASSGQQLGLNIVTELLMGLIIPGQTVPVMTFKSYGYNIMIQCLALSYDLKVGHYLHINPIHMVFSQLLGTIIGAICNTASVWIVIAYFPLGSADWQLTGHTTFFNAGAIWGAIGPMRFFGPESPYHLTNLGYLIGFLLPILPFAANKVFPHPWWRFINFPIMCYTVGSGSVQSSVLSVAIISTIFMYFVFTYSHGWWVKYNYVLSSALDAGSGIAIILATILSVYYPSPMSAINPYPYDFWCTGRPIEYFMEE